MSAVDDVNQLALMAAAGLTGEQAAERLAARVLISPGASEAACSLATHFSNVLARTLRVVTEGPADVHVSIDHYGPDMASTRIHVSIDADCVRFSRTVFAHVCQAEVSAPDLFLKIAACYLAGYTVSHVAQGNSLERLPDPFVLSPNLLGLEPSDVERRIDLDGVVLVGGGGVANGFLWALGSTHVSGHLTVCDPKVVSATNPNRCLYFDPPDVGRAKALVLAEKVKFDHLELVPYVGELGDLVRERGAVRRVITTVDSRIARRSVRNEMSLEVLDTSTTDISEIITFSERQPSTLACLSCVYAHIEQEDARARHIAESLGLDISEVRAPLISELIADKLVCKHPHLNRTALVNTSFDSLFRELCGEGTLLKPGGEQTLAPLGFISNLAGALLVVELLRYERSGAVDTNYLALDPWRPPHRHARRQKQRKPDCSFCGRPEIRGLLAEMWPGAMATSSTDYLSDSLVSQ